MNSFRHTLLVVALLLAATACERQQETAPTAPSPPPTIATQIAFQESIVPELYELPSGALASWRKFSAQKPTLVLFSKHPLLDAIPQERRDGLRNLITTAPDEEVVRRGQLLSADTLYLSPETVSVAIDNGLLGAVVVILPQSPGDEKLSLENFRARARGAGFFSEDELEDLTLENNLIVGTVRGLPLKVGYQSHLPPISTPVLLHVDLGYFQGLYVNEVKTPSYQLIYGLAMDIRQMKWPTLAATLSFSNQEIEFSLESRFLIRDFAKILQQPQLLDEPNPKSWELRAAALYVATMFDEARARALTVETTKIDPQDAAAFYALSLDLFEQRRNDEGFEALAQAVDIDRGYGLAYIDLAEDGLAFGKTVRSIELIEKASTLFPNLPFLKIELADLLLQNGRAPEARPLIASLRQLSWSAQFHPQIPEFLDQMASAAEADPVNMSPPPPRNAEAR